MGKILLVFGTRPEAVKLCPVLHAARAQSEGWDVRVCVTAQHRGLLDQVLTAFGVQPDYDLNLMQPGQSLGQTSARILAGLDPVLRDFRPELVIVQGDTATTLCGALAAFYHGVPVAHVEAGLRTGDFHHPYPEEMNRVLTGRLAALHLAATQGAARNLLREGVPRERVVVTGQSGIDAVLAVKRRLESGELRGRPWPELDDSRKLIVATAHRRESFGAGIAGICDGLLRLGDRPDVQIVFPAHPNPHVAAPVRERLGGHPRISICEPLDYVPFIDLMRRAYLLVTDSGGIQEEGPSLGKPILVTRWKTERPEAVLAGTVKLVGTDSDRLYAEAAALLDEPARYESVARIHNPYGDGHASSRIIEAISRFLSN